MVRLVRSQTAYRSWDFHLDPLVLLVVIVYRVLPDHPMSRLRWSGQQLTVRYPPLATAETH